MEEAEALEKIDHKIIFFTDHNTAKYLVQPLQMRCASAPPKTVILSRESCQAAYDLGFKSAHAEILFPRAYPVRIGTYAQNESHKKLIKTIKDSCMNAAHVSPFLFDQDGQLLREEIRKQTENCKYFSIDFTTSLAIAAQEERPTTFAFICVYTSAEKDLSGQYLFAKQIKEKGHRIIFVDVTDTASVHHRISNLAEAAGGLCVNFDYGSDVGDALDLMRTIGALSTSYLSKAEPYLKEKRTTSCEASSHLWQQALRKWKFPISRAQMGLDL